MGRPNRKAPAVATAGAPKKLTTSIGKDTTSLGWRAQLFAHRFGLPLETAATVAALALGGAGNA